MKRRSFIAIIPKTADLTAGKDVWLKGKDNEPVGTLVNVCADNEDSVALVDCPLDTARNPDSEFYLEEAPEVIFKLAEPPYEVDAKGKQI